MSTLAYGLNVTKKTEPTRVVPAKRKPIFDDDEFEGNDKADNDEVAVEEIGFIDEATGSGPSKSKVIDVPNNDTSSKRKKTSISRYGDISSALASKEHSKKAISLDPSIYDYDAAYDSLQASSQKKKAAQEAEAAERKPKYMSNLLAAAEVRKRDQLRAKEKLLAREREAEGDEFADKDKFVTGAYKAQQEEVRRLEEEERLREEEEERRRKGKGMVGFYRSVLERDEKRHEEVMAAASQVKDDTTVTSDAQATNDQPREKNEADLAKELKDQGRDVALNDEGQVVDKRQLLSAGLNVAPKPRGGAGPATSSSSAHSSTARLPGQGGHPSKAASQRAMRERQTRMLEEQLEQASKKAVQEDDDKKAALEKAAKSRKTETDVSSARERYLQRKREAQQQQQQ